MENNNLKIELETLCNMQTDFWENFKRAVMMGDNSTEEETYKIWKKYFVENNEPIKQLVKVKAMIDKIEGLYK